MQGFAARILLALGLTLTLCAPSAAQNRTSTWEPDVMVRTASEDAMQLWHWKVVSTPEACRDLCIAEPQCTAWQWRTQKDDFVPLHCFLSNLRYIQRLAGHGLAISGVIQGAAANAQPASQQQVKNDQELRIECHPPKEQDNWRCACSENGNEIINSCTRLIQSGRFSGTAAATLYSNRSVGYRRLRQNGRAIADATRAIELNPSYCSAYFNRANNHRELDDNERADADYSTGLRLCPNVAKIYVDRGLTRYLLGRKDAAIADLNEAIRLDPKVKDGYYARGVFYDETGQKQRAIEDFTKAAELGDARAAEELRKLGINR